MLSNVFTLCSKKWGTHFNYLIKSLLENLIHFANVFAVLLAEAKILSHLGVSASGQPDFVDSTWILHGVDVLLSWEHLSTTNFGANCALLLQSISDFANAQTYNFD